MKDLEKLNVLIDKASAIAGSDAKLAQLIGASKQHVSNWRHGSRPCPIEDVALMAGVAGLDAEAWLIRATIERHQGTAKGDRLLKVLGKGLLATGAAIASSGASAMGIFGSHEAPDPIGWVLAAYSTMYSKVKFLATNCRAPKGAFFSAVASEIVP